MNTATARTYTVHASKTDVIEALKMRFGHDLITQAIPINGDGVTLAELGGGVTLTWTKKEGIAG